MAFPTTPVLDDFNRGDELLTASGNWTTGPETGYGSLSVLSNLAGPSAAWKANYWSAAQFGADQEVYCDVPTLPAYRLRLYVRIQSPGASVNAYIADLKSDATVTVAKIVAGTRTALSDDATVFSAGDKLGLEVEGTTLRLWRYSAASWSMIEEVTGQSDVTGAGYIGMEVGDETTVRMDNFGGGAISVIRSQYLDYDYSR